MKKKFLLGAALLGLLLTGCGGPSSSSKTSSSSSSSSSSTTSSSSSSSSVSSSSSSSSIVDDNECSELAFAADVAAKYNARNQKAKEIRAAEGETITLSTVADLQAMWAIANNNNNYVLANDIDCSSLTGFAGSAINFGGTLDGAGFAIKNLSGTIVIKNSGLVFGKLLETAIIKNISFVDCTSEGTLESNALLAGKGTAGAVVSKVTFDSCTVTSAHNYAGLIAGTVDGTSTTGDSLMIEKIKVYNSSVAGSEYTSGLVGRISAGINAVVTDCYLDIAVSDNSQCAGAVFGRLNNAAFNVTMSNIVIKGVMSGAKNVGALVGNSEAGGAIVIEKILVDNFTATIPVNASLSTAVANNKSSATVITVDAATTYYTERTVLGVAVDNVITNIRDIEGSGFEGKYVGTAVESTVLSQAWLEESGLSRRTFAYDAETNEIIPNPVEVPAVEVGFTIDTTNADVTYLVGETVDTSGLIVKSTFDDGSSTFLGKDGYTVDLSGVNSAAAGEYQVSISYKTYTPQTYTVTYEAASSFKVYEDYMNHVFVVGEAFDSSDLIVKGVMSNGEEVLLNKTSYTVDSSTFNSNVPGVYTISVTFSTFAAYTYDVVVMRQLANTANDVVCVSVDKTYSGQEGGVEGKVLNFSNVTDAVAYLKKSGLNENTAKVVNLEPGVYEEKVTIETPNMYLIGKGQTADDVRLSYDAYAGEINLLGATWGTQGSASVSVKSAASNFHAYNVTFENTFDYNGSVEAGVTNNIQAVALVNEADKAVYEKCNFYGYQDTLYAKSGRQYYLGCLIVGNVDFIFGNEGTSFFEECEIRSRARSEGCITAAKGVDGSNNRVDYGYIFYKCTMTAEEGTPDNSVALGRPWGKDATVAYIDCVFGSHILTKGFKDMSGNLPENAFFYVYGNKNVDGTDFVFSADFTGKTLTDAEARRYIKDNLFAVTNGTKVYDSAWDYSFSVEMLEFYAQEAY